MKTTIIDFYHDSKEIIVDLNHEGREFRVEIDLNDFESWLLRKNKLSYTENTTGKTGIMSMDEYWTVYKRYVQADLLAYIKSGNITCNGLPYLFKNVA